MKSWLYRTADYIAKATSKNQVLVCCLPVASGPIYDGRMPFIPIRCARPALCLLAACVLSACGAARVGIGIPVGPFTIGVGAGAGGPSLGVGTGLGPVGLGLGVNAGGQVSGSVGVGASVPVGGGPVRAGVGVGTGAVLYDPHRAPVAVQRGVVVPSAR